MIPKYKINSLFNSVSYHFNGCVIDPGDRYEGFNNISVVLLTHAHFDHIYGLNDVLRLSPNALVYTNEYGREMLLSPKKNLSYYHETPFVFKHPDHIRTVENGQFINIDNGLVAKSIFTPGHNPSCITWVIDDMLFSGDSLIPGIKTVANLPYGQKECSKNSENLIMQLAINRTIYPGHKI